MAVLSRRHFLELAAAASAGLALPRPARADLLSYDDGSASIPGGLGGVVDRVVVVGAGFSGLTVANALVNAGVDCVVVEGRDRLGGRTSTQMVGGVPIDLGAAWVHGLSGNPVARFAAQVGVALLEADPTSGDLSGYDTLTGSISSQDAGAAFGAALDFQDDLGRLRSVLGSGASVAQGITRHLDDAGFPPDARRVVDLVIRTGLVELPYAGPADDLSLDWYFQELGFAGLDHAPVGGYKGLVDAMAQGIDVRLGETVTDIDHGPGGVTVTTQAGQHAGSHAVVTVPLGVLKAGSLNFSPALPAAKTAAIGRLEMGSHEKIVLRFDNAFWQPARENFFYVSTTQGEHPLFLDWTPVAAGQPTLVVDLAGQFGLDLAGMSESAIRARVLAILDEIFTQPVPAPTDVAISRWVGDPFAFGAYSYIPVGASPADMDALAEPVGGRLLFAGEATQSDYYGTVHGAMLSAIREGKRLLQQPSVLLPEPRGGLLGAAALGALALMELLRRRA